MTTMEAIIETCKDLEEMIGKPKLYKPIFECSIFCKKRTDLRNLGLEVVEEKDHEKFIELFDKYINDKYGCEKHWCLAKLILKNVETVEITTDNMFHCVENYNKDFYETRELASKNGYEIIFNNAKTFIHSLHKLEEDMQNTIDTECKYTTFYDNALELRLEISKYAYQVMKILENKKKGEQ